jgi:hypothetical protein
MLENDDRELPVEKAVMPGRCPAKRLHFRALPAIFMIDFTLARHLVPQSGIAGKDSRPIVFGSCNFFAGRLQ